jgi:acyl-CoA synthetase (AMP-forming)/AMP-acid ligase II
MANRKRARSPHDERTRSSNENGAGRMGEELTLPETIHTISEALVFWAKRTPDAPALRAIDGRAWSHRELLRAVGDVASRVSARGIDSDDRIALVLPSGVEAGIALLGAMVAAVAAPLNPESTSHELTRDLQRLAPELVVTGGSSARVSESVAAALGIATVSVGDLLAPAGHEDGLADGLPRRDPESIAVILHTSGTTASPKRVPRPQRTYVACARAARACTCLSSADVAILTAALHTNAGVANLLAALFSGGSCIVAPAFDPVAFPGWLADHRPTWFVSTPTEITLLLDATTAAGREIIAGPESRLRAVRLGSQPLPPGILERAERSLRALIFDGYGMTEASYIAGGGPGTEDRREGSCGRPISTEIRVLDEVDRELPPGTTGAIVIRGPTLFPGYLDDPETNAALFLPGGWFRTGDLGYLDADGFLYLTGRAHEVINRGGAKIAPVQVDHILMRHPAVAEAAVFAVPDTRLGEDIVAAVVLKPDMTASQRELRSWMLDRLTPYKVPRRIWVVEALPRTRTGKVQRGALADRFLNETRPTTLTSDSPRG